jgi:ferrous iron transport protein A
MTQLHEIKIGGKARVTSVDAADEIGIRLLEMGLTPGVEVKLLGVAPLGDPLEFELRGYRLSVRKSEARHVTVEAL